MTRLPCWMMCAATLTVAGCDADGVLGEIVVPFAGIQFVHAVPDTGEMDMRVVDIPSNAVFMDAEFRELSAFHGNIEAGSRRIRVFMSGLDPAISSDVVWDTVFTFQQDVKYTFALRGYARPGQTPALGALILTDADPPAIPAGQVAVRVWHLAPTLDPAATTPVDAWILSRGPGAITGTPAIANVAYGDRTAYVNVPIGNYRIAFTPAGTTGPVLFQANMPAGTAGDSIRNPIAGTMIPASGITAIIAGRSVPGSRAPVGAAAGAVDSVVRRVDTAVVYSTLAHGLSTNDVVRVSGATESEYSGSFVVSAVGISDSVSGRRPFFRYLIAGTPASPATGTPLYRAGTADFANPNVLFRFDKRPPDTFR
jgi:hypothetical protein